MTVTESQVREQLKQVIDPELFINIVDLGLIYTIEMETAEESEAGGEQPAEDAATSPTAEAPAASDATPDPAPQAASSEAASPEAASSEAASREAAASQPAAGEGAPADADPGATAEEPVHVKIDMTMTSPMCPAGPQLVANSKQVVGQIPGVTNVEVRVVMDPPWTPDRMTDEAKDKLGIF